MSETLKAALESMINDCGDDLAGDQRAAILLDLLWKLVRKDYHGVCDCANDLRELHL